MSKKQLVILEREQVGGVGVDSGQLLVSDPCYLGRFEANDPTGLRDPLRHKDTGKEYKYGVDFGHYDWRFDGEAFSNIEDPALLTVNEMIADGTLVQDTSRPIDDSYSYRGCAHTTCRTPENHGEIGSFPGEGFVFSTGGDGYHPVYRETVTDGKDTWVRYTIEPLWLYV